MGEIETDEKLCIPKWINVENFHDILLKDVPGYEKVHSFNYTGVIPPGENFLSIMIRVNMELQMKDGDRKHKTYVVKTMLEDDNGGAFVKKIAAFPKEMEMYEKYLPAFGAMYKAHGWDIQFAPRCLHVEQIGDSINFVFEDLKAKRFVNIDRLRGFNMNEMRSVLKKLAAFHAASAVYAEQNGPYPVDYKYGFAYGDAAYEFQKHLYTGRVDSFKKAMKLWGLEDADEYVERFPTFNQYWRCIQRNISPDPKRFNVLNHGDIWSSNVMLNYTPAGLVDDLLLVDFQLCKWGSPAEDLHFVIIISAGKSIRLKEYDHFIAIYHEHLAKCLKVLGYKKTIPRLRDLQMEMFSEAATFYAFYAIFNHVMVLLLPTDKDSNVKTLMDHNEEAQQFRMRALLSPLVADAMRDIVPFFYRRGVFNFEDFD